MKNFIFTKTKFYVYDNETTNIRRISISIIHLELILTPLELKIRMVADLNYSDICLVWIHVCWSRIIEFYMAGIFCKAGQVMFFWLFLDLTYIM